MDAIGIVGTLVLLSILWFVLALVGMVILVKRQAEYDTTSIRKEVEAAKAPSKVLELGLRVHGREVDGSGVSIPR